MGVGKRLRVVVVSKADASGGGASKVADLLARWLAPHADVLHLLTHSASPERWQRPVRRFPGLTWLDQSCATLSRWLGTPDYVSLDWLMFALRTRLAVDVVHFHDVMSAFSPASIGLLGRWLPVCWTFHDCAPITGGCIQPLSCDRYAHTCGPCPRLGQWPLVTATDATAWMQAHKRRLAASGRYHPICPSQWMARMAMTAGAFDVLPTVIPNPVDVQRFAPGDKAALKARLGVSADRLVVLLSAGSMADPFKGVEHGVAALRKVRDLSPVVIPVGHQGHRIALALPGLDVRPVGYVRDQQALADLYAAADLLLYPTMADNLPLAAIECMASGTPLVAFDTGGMPEIVCHGIDGYLAPRGQTEALSDRLREALTSRDRLAQWGRAARAHALESFAPTTFIDAHLRAYTHTIETFATTGRSWAPVSRETTPRVRVEIQ